jgi:hypothetical protein
LEAYGTKEGRKRNSGEKRSREEKNGEEKGISSLSF